MSGDSRSSLFLRHRLSVAVARGNCLAVLGSIPVWSAVCVKTQNDAGIYNSCWYLRFMLVFTIHAGIYTSCWYRKYQYEV